MKNALVLDAREFAHWAHASIDQRRKYTGESYIVHPAEVAHIVSSVAHTPEMLAAAWLHDTVEDVPGVSIELIHDRFGTQVGQLVDELTSRSGSLQVPREQRKALDRIQLARASPPAKTVKLADIISNTRDVVVHNRAFARVYLPEKLLSLEALTAGDAQLLERARQCMLNAVAQLE